jgi:hypothetical protein
MPTAVEILSLLISPATKLFTWTVRKFKKPDPVPILKRREELKIELESHFHRRDKYGTRGEAIIRDINRMDSYPELDEHQKGISPWFTVEVKDVYHRGIEVFIHVRKSIKKDKNGRWAFADQKDEGAITAYPVGRIPFDLIEYINWNGDEHYNLPQIYCRFKDGQPYEGIPFYVEYQGSTFLVEAKGFRPWDKEKRFWQFWR